MNYFKLDQKYLLQTYKRQKIVFSYGKGKYLWDTDGKKYLDFFSGLSVCNLGHSHPKVISAVKNQLNKYTHVSNLYYIELQIKLAKLLIEKSFKSGKVFFSNSGAEANECAIKLAIKRASNKAIKGKEKYEIISFKNSFHGRTLATLSATGQEKFHKGFKPLLSGFKFAEFNNIDSVRKLINKYTCAVIVEPVQGEGGVYPAEKNFLKGLREICNKHHLLLIFDEIQCGLSRTGSLFAYQHYNIEPDIVTLAKSISNGLPLGVTIVREKYADLFKVGDHGSTFGGNPVSCASAIEVVKLLSNKRLLQNVNSTGEYFFQKLLELKNKYPEIIKEVRGLGLMLGIELLDGNSRVGDWIVQSCAENKPTGLIINCTQEKVLRFLPPLIITKADIDFAVSIVDKVLGIWYNKYCETCRYS
ncbi:MAG: aspartate aminotransferase family protein [Elusimicrobiota bacterium]|nr:aspartate aminotransferase family protein [Elusimicrobiota bacterium]